ncbi:hypothetical protein BDN72DRAFT_674170 [Pluteus cervinus]|uniref:Uncharacterized protein n=1 Tax=Pluteus cervinus TaxID=181527 RepID=A0ACD3A0M6_9AGAR|nr:hypothetical protein BDN72DRAFT_674170 [Pluteus cervinus]
MYMDGPHSAGSSSSGYVNIQRPSLTEDQLLQPPSPADSTTCTENHRWSELVPPNTGLGFGVVLNPREGTAVFSGAQLLAPPSTDDLVATSPIDAVDSHSQVLTIGRSTIPFSENTATLGYFRDQQAVHFSTRTPLFDGRMAHDQTRRSSTLGGLDVYLRGSCYGRSPPSRRVSRLDEVDMDFQQDPLTSFVRLCLRYADGELDENASGLGLPDIRGPAAYPPSPTGSTSTHSSDGSHREGGARMDSLSSTWSALDSTHIPGIVHSPMCPQSRRRGNRRLMKRRRPAALDPVYSGSTPNLPPRPASPPIEDPHITFPSEETLYRLSACARRCGLPNLADSLRKWTKLSSYTSQDNDAWVWIELTQEVTQHYLESMSE